MPTDSSKKSKRTKKANKRKVGKPNMKHDNIDVKSKEDVEKLVEHIKNNPVVLVLIYADWCGHCGVFKNGVWKKLVGTKGRNIPMAQINEKVLDQTPLSGVKIDGYPTNILVGNDMRAASIRDSSTGEATNALPNTNDLPIMTKLVRANPSQLMAENSMSGKHMDDVSATPTPEAARAIEEKGEELMKDVKNNSPLENINASTKVANPPDVEEDLVYSQTSATNTMPSKKENLNAVGGALYTYLLQASKIVAPAVALTAAGSLTRKHRRRHKKRTAKRRA